jgi:aerobic-type carbon monoxide dehydrogenase small subunit (CoxS/CutS family)
MMPTMEGEAMEMTLHAQRRARGRCFSTDLIQRLMDWGEVYDAGKGCLAYFIGRRSVKEDRKALLPCMNRAVVAYGERVVTVHHCQHPPRSWKRVA